MYRLQAATTFALQLAIIRLRSASRWLGNDVLLVMWKQSICPLPRTFQKSLEFLYFINRAYPEACLINLIYVLKLIPFLQWLEKVNSQLTQMQSDGVFAMRSGKSASYLWSEHIEVPSPIGTADELAFVLGRDARIFGDPNHRGTQSVGVQV